VSELASMEAFSAFVASAAMSPYELHDLILRLLVHMVVVGLPISFSVRRFAK
jgi:hypothetical protein